MLDSDTDAVTEIELKEMAAGQTNSLFCDS